MTENQTITFETLESHVRAQLFRLQLSIVEAHEEVLASVRQHASSWGQAPSPQKSICPMGAQSDQDATPPKPPALPRAPPTPKEDFRERGQVLHELQMQRFLSDEQEQQMFGVPGSATSSRLGSKIVESQRLPGLPDEQSQPRQGGLAIAGKVAVQDKATVPGSVAEKAWNSEGSAEGSPKGRTKPWASEGTQETEVTNESDHPFNGEDTCGRGAKFQLLPMWLPVEDFEARGSLKAALQHARSGRNMSMETASPKEFMDYFNLDEKLDKENADRSTQNAVHPHSVKRGIWDICSLVLVIYDMIFIPLQLFDIQPNAFTSFVAWTSRLFWTGDIVASFITGFVREDGSYELCLPRIGKRYLKTWFVLDAIIVFADWMEIFWDASGGAGYARMGKATRVLRIVRMVRLLRLVRMQLIIKLIIERINSERLSILANILRLLTAIGGFAHIMACVWYGISVNAGDEAWVEFYDMVDKGLGLQYSVSLHWSFSQFTGGMDEFVPHNLDERIFAILAFLLAFMLSGLFVSSLTSSMTQLAMISSYYSQRLSTLRKYMHQNGISKRLAVRVQRNASYALREQQRFVPEDQVVVMAIVSEPLRVEVHFEMYSAIANRHPFFDRYTEECPQVMKKVCHRAMTMMAVSPGDVIFSPGEIALQPRMFFICSGSLQYVAASAMVSSVEGGSWISEAVIWTHWMHRGQLTAVKECRLCALEAPVFQHIVSRFEHPDFDPRDYAAAFVKDLNDHVVEAVDLPSDNFDYEAALGNNRVCERQQRSGRMSIVRGALAQLTGT